MAALGIHVVKPPPPLVGERAAPITLSEPPPYFTVETGSNGQGEMSFPVTLLFDEQDPLLRVAGIVREGGLSRDIDAELYGS